MPTVTAYKLLELSEPAKMLIAEAERRFYKRCTIAGWEMPLFLYHMPNGKVLYEAIHREQIGRRLVLSLALRDENGNWVKGSLYIFKKNR